jgi:hypothetical protein
MGQGFGKDKIEQRHVKLEQKKDLLVRLGEVIEWEAFRASLETIHEKPRKSKAGRKNHDVILMFKLLILQQLYNISLLPSPLRRETLLQGCAPTMNWSIKSTTVCRSCDFWD